MKILLTGKDGQLGSRLEEDLKVTYEVIATNREALNLEDFQLVKLRTYQIQPDLIVNTAAYTDVDNAEKEKRLAYKINALAPKALSHVAKELDIPIIHVSTDYVFDGSKKDSYLEDDQVNPLSFYGKTKGRGEDFIRQAPKHFILRTSWIFSSRGPNFLQKIVKLAQERSSLKVVDDQWGSPTSVNTISIAIQAIIHTLNQQNNSNIYGTYHISSYGKTNRYLYVNKILDFLGDLNIEVKLKKDYLIPVSSSQYPQVATRPKNPILNTTKFKKTFMIKLPRWEDDIFLCLASVSNKKHRE